MSRIPACLLALTVASCAASDPRSVGRPGVRALPWSQSETIPARLRPDDLLVYVYHPDGKGMVWAGGGSKADVLDATLRLQSGRPLVVVVVDEVHGTLTNDKLWVETRLMATIAEVIRPSLNSAGGRLSRDERIEIRYSGGGQARVAETEVRAGDVADFTPGQRYLVFLDEPDARGVRRISDDLLLMLDRRDKIANVKPLKSGLDGLSLDHVRKAVSKRL